MSKIPEESGPPPAIAGGGGDSDGGDDTLRSPRPISETSDAPPATAEGSAAGDDTRRSTRLISEVSDPPPAIAGGSASGGDTRRSTRPGTKRLLLSLSVLLSFLSSLPFLLKSTEIHRSDLPIDSITSLSSRFKSDPHSFLCRFEVVLLLPPNHRTLDAERLSLSISDDINTRTSAGGYASNYTISVTVDSGSTGCYQSLGSSWRCGAVGVSNLDGDDEAVDEVLDLALGSDGGRVYTVVVVEDEEMEEVRAVVGKHRHAWMMGRVSEIDVVSAAGRIFVEYFMNGGRSKGDAGLGEEESRPVGLDGTLVLSFSLLNANPEDWVYDWNFQMIDVMLAQVVDALAPVANISVESQVLYYTPKSSISYWDDKLGSYSFSLSDLPFFVNSNEWHLDTSIAAGGRSKVLQFSVYIPAAAECPLVLHLPNGDISNTNAFISPMWGGVVIWNPLNCSRDFLSTHPTRSTISPQDLHKIFQVFIGQLRILFGFKSDYFISAERGISSFLASKSGFTEWELDVLYRRYARYNLISSITTLESLSNLVQSLPRMIVMDEIGKQVKLSLDAASLAQQTASLGIYDNSAVSSRKARALAEDAFFHPSIMSISYSSNEHYFAIYMPFFAPVLLHVFIAAVKEIKRYRRERAKYLAFVADQAKGS